MIAEHPPYLLLASTLCATLASVPHIESGEPFVVHEWGVCITDSALVFDGGPGRAIPRSVLAPPRELISNLPPFVGRHEFDYHPSATNHGWDKPVLHFYGGGDGEISIEIRTPHGRPLAYWPLPTLIEQTDTVRHERRMIASSVTDAFGMRWTGRLTDTIPTGALPPVPAGHWWQRCREIPGRYLRTSDGDERFLFYEGMSQRSPTVISALGPDKLWVTDYAVNPMESPVVVIVNDSGLLRLGTLELMRSKKDDWATATLRSADLRSGGDGDEAILSACRAQWEAFGMTPVEAQMIVEVWREDLLGRPGFLVISRMSPADYEAMFPLTITPKPDQLVRVGLVFDTLPTVSATVRLSWLPRLSAEMKRWAADLAGADGPQRSAAISGLAKARDLALPVLHQLLSGTDLRARAAALDLLGRLRLPTLIETPVQSQSNRERGPRLDSLIEVPVQPR
jgi:hypothetical protein